MDKLFLEQLATTHKALQEYALRLEPGRVEREQLYQSLRIRQEISTLQQTVEQLDDVLAQLYERID